jgi:hypothetical protein
VIATKRWRALALAVLVISVTGCTGDESGSPLRVDERRGTVNGVGIDDGPAAMKRTFGETAAADPDRERASPLSVDVGEYEGPSHFRLGPPFYRYERVSFFAEGGRIVGFMVVGDAGQAGTRPATSSSAYATSIRTPVAARPRAASTATTRPASSASVPDASSGSAATR